MKKDLFAGEERELSIMFTDLRGFTGLSERLNSRQVVSLLNRYFTPMAALVRNNSGTLDKFMGDALLAFWNAPFAVRDHPVLAVETALRMQEEVAKLNVDIEADFGCIIRMGAGIHTGRVYVGNIGSDDLVNYTPIGDSANLACHLEGLCSRYDVETIVSSATMEYCHENAPGKFFFLPLDTLRVKGRERPVSVYAALRPDAEAAKRAEFKAYEDAHALYRAGDFAGAARAFSALREERPGVTLYSLYAERLFSLQKAAPGEWDGVWTLETK